MTNLYQQVRPSSQRTMAVRFGLVVAYLTLIVVIAAVAS